MNRLYAWDEIDAELKERDPEDWFRTAAEGGWTTEGWYSKVSNDEFPHGVPVVEVSTTGRHIALSTWAATKQDAHELFMERDEYAASHEQAAVIEDTSKVWVAIQFEGMAAPEEIFARVEEGLAEFKKRGLAFATTGDGNDVVVSGWRKEWIAE